MDAWKALRKELRNNNAATDPQYKEADYIIKQLDSILLQNAGHSKFIPPLELIIHAIHGITDPPFLQELLSEFLDLLAMVDFYRSLAIDRINLIFSLDSYMGSKVQYTSLSEDTKKSFHSIMKNSDDLRAMYIKIVTECCFLDLKRQWLASSNTDFWIRWNEYFSILKDPQAEKHTHTFHHNLSDAEKGELRKMGQNMSLFMTESIQAATNHREGSNAQEGFQERLPNQEFPAKFLDIVDYYLNCIQEIVDLLEENGHELYNI